MKRLIAVCLFFAIVQSPGLSQNRVWLDSLRNELQSAQSDTLRVHLINRIGQIYMFDRPDSGIYYASKALSLTREINHPQEEVVALRQLSFSLRELGNHTTALQISLKTLKISEKYNFIRDKALILGQIGLIYLDAGNHKQALESFKESKEIFDSVQESDFSVMTQGRLIDTYLSMEQYDSALYYSEIAVNELELLQNKWPLRPLFLSVGKVHHMTGNYSLANIYFQEVVDLVDTIGLQGGLLSAAFYNLALIQKDLNNVDSSAYYLQRSLFEAQYRGHYPQIIDAYRMMASIYESQDPVQANEYNRLALVYKDSLELIGKRVALETFIEFDEQERQQELAAAEAAFQSRLRTNTFLGSSFTLIVIALLLYRSNRAKHKSKQKIEKAYNQLKETQTQLIHSEKMVSLGELTAGIAHEIQNPLNFVNNFSEVNKELLEELKEAQASGDTHLVESITRDLMANENKIMQHGKRAEAIVKSMLQHSRGSSGEKEPTDINALADEYLRLAYHGFRAKDKSFNASFRTELADDLPKINVVAQDIGRVLLNLVNNAFQAVKDVNQPEVVVATRNGAKGIEISVSDNGPGIPAEIKEKIFQPFFTTKASGEGTGLGLSLSYDIITKGHSGQLTVGSKEGADLPAGQAGSIFTIILPKT